MKRVLAIAFGAILCLALAAPAMAAGRHAVPLTGWGSGIDSTGDVTTCPEGAAVRYHSEGTGQMSHLGRVAAVVDHCVWLDSPTTGHFGSGTITFTAADGDALILGTSGTFEFVMTPEGPFSNVDLDWTVIGGTGRFASATGAGKAAPVSDLVAGITSATYWGTIAYDASDRSAH